MIDILKDPKTGITDMIHICYECDLSGYPSGKPIVNDPGAIKNEKGDSSIRAVIFSPNTLSITSFF